MNPVIFDMDGVLIDSEGTWDEELRLFAKDRGGRWTPEAQQDTMGMGSREACVYMRDVLGFQGDVAEIDAALDSRLLERYRTSINEIPGASNAVRRLSHAGVPLGLASSANRCLIDAVLDRLQVSHLFATIVSGQDVARGKPAPDIYLEAARRLGAKPQLCVAIEDSANGVRSASSAHLQVIVLEHPEYKLAPNVMGLASAVLVYVERENFQWVTGEECTSHYDLPSAKSFSTTFCATCGSPLPHRTRSGHAVVVPAGSLDVEPGVLPQARIFWESRASWTCAGDAVPTFSTYPDWWR